MKHWTEFRTAYYVADTGSISKAAKIVGVHRATVLRHIDVLEQELGAKVFIRNPKGYQLTEVGEDLHRVARLTEEQLMSFSGRTQGQTGELDGEFIITSMDSLSSVIAPAICLFNKQYPKIKTRWLCSLSQMKLEYGQVHVAIRSGPKPNDDDYVVLPFVPLKFGLYASDDYLSEYKMPTSEQELRSHKFVALETMHTSLELAQWFRAQCASLIEPDQMICTSQTGHFIKRHFDFQS